MPEFATPAEWFLAHPWVGISIVLWVVGAIVLEQLALRAQSRPFDVEEAKTSVTEFCAVGIAQTTVSLLAIPLLNLVHPYRFHTLSMDEVWHWVLAWVFVDFAYYWIHRLLHLTRAGWMMHAPHHSIRQLSTIDSLRTSWGEQPVGVFAYGIPLVLMGVPPYLAGIFYLFVALYQQIVHTEIDWHLGPLSALVYTPSAHRVHHSTVRREADSNFGGFFTIFDRVFGTWVQTRPAERPEVYGLPDGRVPANVKEILFDEMVLFLRGLRRQPGLWPKVVYAFTPPDRIGAPHTDR